MAFIVKPSKLIPFEPKQGASHKIGSDTRIGVFVVDKICENEWKPHLYI